MNAKEIVTVIGPAGNQQQSIVKLNGVLEDEPLTPKLARRALRVAGPGEGEAWELDHSVGYRVYAHSARKLKA